MFARLITYELSRAGQQLFNDVRQRCPRVKLETVSRLLSRLVDEGLLLVNGWAIRLLDRRALSQLDATG